MAHRGLVHCLATSLLKSVAWCSALGLVVWAFGALHYDSPLAPAVMSWGFVVIVAGLVFMFQGSWKKLLALLLPALAVLAWWLTQPPLNDRPWQADVAQLAWAEIHGDEVTLHNVRDCDYRTATDYTPRWGTRTVRLSQITGIDLAICYWGSPWMAHPIASFQFADAPPVCFSIETRKEVGEKYSAIGGFYRRYELIYTVAEERDVIRVRSNFRKGEEVFLYQLKSTPEQARVRFMDYVATLNQLHEKPRWYNAATTNCTTSIRTQHAVANRSPWDWRILLNGKGDEMLYERGAFVTGGLAFHELRARARINEAARGADPSGKDFSSIIRVDRPGFDVPPPPEVRSVP